jgi:Pyruvate/2-oxoacid:ferredoxin oxidoreductase delta subunit
MKLAGHALWIGAALLLALQFLSPLSLPGGALLALLTGLPALGALILAADRYLRKPPGIDNDRVFFNGISAGKWPAWILALLITGLYVVIYSGNQIRSTPDFTLHDLFQKHIYSLFNPLAYFMNGKPADNWFFYTTVYSLAMVVFGARMLMKYRHNRYQQIRTLSVVFFQVGFAFVLPSLLKAFQQPEFYFSYFWPLKYQYLFPSEWSRLSGGTGLYFLSFAAVMSFVSTPVLTYFYGKRWYCSWVCGCGGLAETAGDPFRQLSSKSLISWKLERYLIHAILVFISLLTALLWYNSWQSGALFGELSQALSNFYGFFIGMIFSGVVGVGFYPLLGSRVWCRFGCPMAAYLGILQKFFSRFRITTNGGQCISCGNCSTYCEMGIDVRWYAQREQNIIRASCVGCGICAAVCPRGVLRLENGPLAERYNKA